MGKQKRTGVGGNSSKDPRNNLVAQINYIQDKQTDLKKCTGFLHFDGPDISIHQFRQQKANKTSHLQSRCDICNRLYFAITQKPKVRIAAYVIFAEQTGVFNWRDSIPETLIDGVKQCLNEWQKGSCGATECKYDFNHGNFRNAVEQLTQAWRDRDKETKNAFITDSKTQIVYPAPEFMEAMQNWAGAGGILYQKAERDDVWTWWANLFPNDQASDSAERNAVASGRIQGPLPLHPIWHFPWGSGNMLDTIEGHSVPGFNKVKSSYSNLKNSSNVGSRYYAYLVEGDRRAMAALSRACKDENMSLGHHPAPLRWLGKDDPINGIKQNLTENINDGDSLVYLYKEVLEDPEKATQFVSWQIKDTILELGRVRPSFEVFTQVLQSRIETYFDDLLENYQEDGSRIRDDLERAEPGRTESEYSRREVKITEWLESRPTARIKLK